MPSLVKRPIIAPCTKHYHNAQTPHTYVIHESFLLYFISKIVARLEKAEAPCYV